MTGIPSVDPPRRSHERRRETLAAAGPSPPPLLSPRRRRTRWRAKPGRPRRRRGLLSSPNGGGRRGMTSPVGDAVLRGARRRRWLLPRRGGLRAVVVGVAPVVDEAAVRAWQRRRPKLGSGSGGSPLAGGAGAGHDRAWSWHWAWTEAARGKLLQAAAFGAAVVLGGFGLPRRGGSPWGWHGSAHGGGVASAWFSS